MEKNEVLIYVTEDGTVKLEITMESEKVWFNLNQLCELFQRDKFVISRHIKNIYTEGELEESSTVAFFATVQNEGGRGQCVKSGEVETTVNGSGFCHS